MHPLQSAPARSQACCRITAREKLGCGVRRAKNRRLSPACLERRCCQETDWRPGCAFEAEKSRIRAGPGFVRELKYTTGSKTECIERSQIHTRGTQSQRPSRRYFPSIREFGPGYSRTDKHSGYFSRRGITEMELRKRDANAQFATLRNGTAEVRWRRAVVF